MASQMSRDEQRVRHLEMIQSVVARLASYQFYAKGWTLTVAVALLGFAVSNHEWRLTLVSLVPTLTFWGLDLYFLHSERLFRALFNRVRDPGSAIEPFFMAATDEAFEKSLPKQERSWWAVAKRPAVLYFYLGVVISTALVFWFTFDSASPPPKEQTPTTTGMHPGYD